MAPKILLKQVNNDVLKQTLFDKKINYGPGTLAGLAKLVMRKELNLTDLDSLSQDDVITISKELQLAKISKKTNTMLMEEIKHVAKMYIAGQGKIISQWFYLSVQMFYSRSLPHVCNEEGPYWRLDGCLVCPRYKGLYYSIIQDSCSF